MWSLSQLSPYVHILYAAIDLSGFPVIAYVDDTALAYVFHIRIYKAKLATTGGGQKSSGLPSIDFHAAVCSRPSVTYMPTINKCGPCAQSVHTLYAAKVAYLL